MRPDEGAPFMTAMMRPAAAGSPLVEGAASAGPAGAAPVVDPDDALIRRIAAGDEQAWPALVDRHLTALIALGWHMLGSRGEAEDVAQETFVRLMRKVENWQTGGPKLRTWLTRVATNLCIDRHRARRHLPLEAAEAEPDPAPDQGGGIERRLDLARNVKGALDALPERQRIAITLVHYQGCTNGEAAALLEVSVDALESLLARGRRALRSALRPVAADLLAGS